MRRPSPSVVSFLLLVVPPVRLFIYLIACLSVSLSVSTTLSVSLSVSRTLVSLSLSVSCTLVSLSLCLDLLFYRDVSEILADGESAASRDILISRSLPAALSLLEEHFIDEIDQVFIVGTKQEESSLVVQRLLLSLSNAVFVSLLLSFSTSVSISVCISV